MLTDDQASLYRRNILLPGVGVEGQEKICSGKILIVGAGGLGSAAALYCADESRIHGGWPKIATLGPLRRRVPDLHRRHTSTITIEPFADAIALS